MGKARIIMNNLGQTFETDELRDQYYSRIVGYIREHGFDVETVNGREGDEELTISQLKGADAVIFSSNGPVTEKVLTACPQLKLVIRYGVGLNSVDLPACTRHGVVVINEPGYCRNELALHALALGMAALRNLYLYDSNIRKGVWLKGNGPLPIEPFNMTMGIVGLGAAGRVLAKILMGAFGAPVIAYDPYCRPEDAAALGVELVSKEELCRRAQWINITAPLTPETRHLISWDEFKLMSPKTIITNISRGPIIDNEALLDALKTHKIYGAGIDVFEHEPVKADSEFCRLDNIIMSPHNAYYGVEALENIDFLISRMMVRFFDDKVIYRRHLCNPDIEPQLEGFTIRDCEPEEDTAYDD